VYVIQTIKLKDKSRSSFSGFLTGMYYYILQSVYIMSITNFKMISDNNDLTFFK